MSIRRVRLAFAFTLLALFSLLTASALAQEPLPEPRGYVNDFAGVLDASDASELEAFLKGLEERTTAEVAVATVPDLDGYADVEEYAVKLFEKWKIGKKAQDNGVLVLLAMKEKKVRIEVGYGLEGAITDGTAGEIIRGHMAPYFKQGEYGAGLLYGARAIAERIPSSGVRPPEKKFFKGREIQTLLSAIFAGLMLFVYILPGLMGRRSRRRFWGGPGGPFIGGFGGGFGGGGGGGFGGGFGGFGGGGSGGGGASGGW